MNYHVIAVARIFLAALTWVQAKNGCWWGNLFYSFRARKQSWGSELVAWENGWWQNCFENRISICALHGSASCGLPWDYQQITRAQISWLRQNRFCQKTKSVFLTALIEVEKGPVPISQRKFPTNSLLTAFNCCRYQNDLPKKIKGRGKEGHVTHEELVQTIKWKLAVSSVNHVCVPRNCIIS